jgi:response regulator RpfG family c-di-GMP phosphodiesterase
MLYTESVMKEKLNQLCKVFVRELKRTTEILKRLISASKTNTDLNETYEELGRLLVKGIENNEISCQNERVAKLIEKVKRCENDLASMEDEVNQIKFSASK